MAETADTSMPESMLNARRLYKHSTAGIIDWLCFTNSIKKKPAIQQSKKRRGKPKTQGGGMSNGEKIMTADEILSCANCIVNSKATRPQYIKWAFKTALLNRRLMTAWYRTRDIEDSEDTRKLGHFTETLQQAFEILFPPTAEDGLVAPKSSSRRSSHFANAFGPLDGISTDKESTLSEAEMQDLLASWMGSNAKPRSRIADDDLDEKFNQYSYLLEMDLMIDAVMKCWILVAKGEMSVPLAAWLTRVGYSGIARMCEEYRNVRGIDHESLVQEFMRRNRNSQAVTGQITAGHDSQYKELSTGIALYKPTIPLRDQKYHKQMEKNINLVLCAESPFDHVLPPSEEAAHALKLHTESAGAILEPWRPALPAHEEHNLRAAINGLTQRPWSPLTRSLQPWFIWQPTG